MKKILFLFVMTVMTAQATMAQNSDQSSKQYKWYVGYGMGFNIPAATFKFSGNTNFQSSFRAGYRISPVFGVMGQFDMIYGGAGPNFSVGKTINAITATLQGTVNVTNLFDMAHYNTRRYDVTAKIGVGPAHMFRKDAYHKDVNDCVVSPISVDFAMKLGSESQWQVFAEPSLLYMVYDDGRPTQYNISAALFNFNVGVIYNFNFGKK